MSSRRFPTSAQLERNLSVQLARDLSVAQWGRYLCSVGARPPFSGSATSVQWGRDLCSVGTRPLFSWDATSLLSWDATSVQWERDLCSVGTRPLLSWDATSAQLGRAQAASNGRPAAQLETGAPDSQSVAAHTVSTARSIIERSVCRHITHATALFSR